MGGIFADVDVPAQTMGDVSLAIHHRGAHVGILYRDAAGSIELIHLAGHFDLCQEAYDPDRYPVWVRVELPPGRDAQVAELCALIYEETGAADIPYAFGEPNGLFDALGQLHLGPGRLGLTCATFVLAVFDAAALPLVDYANWPARPGDAAWRAEVLTLLHDMGASDEHIAALATDDTSVRYHPREVGGAAAADEYPASFAEAVANADMIAGLLRRLRG